MTYQGNAKLIDDLLATGTSFSTGRRKAMNMERTCVKECRLRKIELGIVKSVGKRFTHRESGAHKKMRS